MPLNAGQANKDPGEVTLSREEARNRLEYLADLLIELQHLTGSLGGPTLSGLLTLAHTMQARRLDQSGDEGH